ncbi:MAG: ABC transporter transmembrane domain-containing protein [Litorilinea sp.]
MRMAYICADPGIPVFGNKGASIHVQEVVRALQRQGITVELFAARLGGEPPPGLEHVPTHALPEIGKVDAAAREQRALAANAELKRRLEQQGPFALVYERYSLWSYAGMDYARDHDCPGLLEVNAPLIEEQQQHRTLIHTEEANRVARRTFAAAQALLPVSQGVGDYLANFTEARGKTHVLPNGVDPQRFPLDLPPAQPRVPGTFTVSFVGTLKAWHGLDSLVHAFVQLYAQDPSTRLLIVGDGPCREQLEAQIDDASIAHAVHFTGAVDHEQVPAWLRAMDVGVAPYPPLEDFYFSPLKVYEYMAAGLPTVASQIGQITDLIQHGHNGLLVRAGAVDELVDALQMLRNDAAQAARLARAARATIEEAHTWDHVAARIQQLALAPTLSRPDPNENDTRAFGVDDADSDAHGDGDEDDDDGDTSRRTETASFQTGPAKAKRPASAAQTVPGLRRILGRFRREIAGQWHLLLLAFVALWFNVGLRLLEPWPLKIVVDILGGQPLANVPAFITQYFADMPNAGLLIAAAVALLVITVGRAAANFASTIGLAVAGNRVLIRARSALYNHLLHLPLAYHAQAKTGDLLTRLIGDVARLQEVATTAMLPLAVNMGTLVGMVAIMLWLNWQLALLGMISLPLASLLMQRQSGRIRTAARRQRQREGMLAASAAETLHAMPVVHTFGLQGELEKSFQAAAQKDLKESVRTTRYAATLERSVDICIGLGLALTLWYGGRIALAGALTPGDLVVFLSYLKSAYRPMNDLAKYTGRLAKAVASGERVLDVLDTIPIVTDLPHAVAAPQKLGRITFEDVGFGYTPDRPALRGLSLDVPAGTRVALVGPSGGGKSTLVSLLPRLYDPTAGRILIDGTDIRDYTVASLRARMSVVPQAGMLFGVSVRENIAYGALGVNGTEDGAEEGAEEGVEDGAEISDARIEAAARLANAHDFIMQLPDGYATILSEGGTSLSGGQRQRLAIARAAVRDADIVLLDEPTTGLDSTNAQAVYLALERLVEGRTSFCVSHDMHAVQNADIILYIAQGAIREQGTHAELIARRGAYAALYHDQPQFTPTPGGSDRLATEPDATDARNGNTQTDGQSPPQTHTRQAFPVAPANRKPARVPSPLAG